MSLFYSCPLSSFADYQCPCFTPVLSPLSQTITKQCRKLSQTVSLFYPCLLSFLTNSVLILSPPFPPRPYRLAPTVSILYPCLLFSRKQYPYCTTDSPPSPTVSLFYQSLSLSPSPTPSLSLSLLPSLSLQSL